MYVCTLAVILVEVWSIRTATLWTPTVLHSVSPHPPCMLTLVVLRNDLARINPNKNKWLSFCHPGGQGTSLSDRLQQLWEKSIGFIPHGQLLSKGPNKLSAWTPCYRTPTPSFSAPLPGKCMEAEVGLAALLLSSVEIMELMKPKKPEEVGFLPARLRAQLVLSDAFHS